MNASINWATIGSDNGLLAPGRKAITWTNVDFLSIGPLETNQWNSNKNTQLLIY